MTDTYQRPCEIWAEHLAAPAKDLTEAERALLDEHVASCPACAATRSSSAVLPVPLGAVSCAAACFAACAAPDRSY